MLILSDLGSDPWVISLAVAANVAGWVGVQHIFRNKNTSLKRSLYIGGWSTVLAMISLLVIISTDNSSIIIMSIATYTASGLSLMLIGANIDHYMKYNDRCKYNLSTNISLIQDIILAAYILILFVIIYLIGIKAYLLISAIIGISLGLWMIRTSKIKPFNLSQLLPSFENKPHEKINFNRLIITHIVTGVIVAAIWQTLTPIVTIKALHDFNLGDLGAQMSGSIFIIGGLTGSIIAKVALAKFDPKSIFLLATIVSAICLPIITMAPDPYILFISYFVCINAVWSWMLMFSGTFYELDGNIKALSKQISYIKALGGLLGAVLASLAIAIDLTLALTIFLTTLMIGASIYYAAISFLKNDTVT